MCKLPAVSHEHEGTAIFQNISNYTSQHVLVLYKTWNLLQHCCGPSDLASEGMCLSWN